MSTINNTTAYPVTEADSSSRVIGTDPTDTSQHADGRTVQFALFDVVAKANVSTSVSGGTITTGTFTADGSNGKFQHYTNGGAHTLGVPTGSTEIVLDVTNDGSAGAITTGGFDVVDGDALTTTDTEAFRLFISVGNAGSVLTVKAMQ